MRPESKDRVWFDAEDGVWRWENEAGFGYELSETAAREFAAQVREAAEAEARRKADAKA
jgi:hypothetical protein